MHWTKHIAALVVAVSAVAAIAQTPSNKTGLKTALVSSENNWWKNAVFYEIYPRSFQDSNGDGIGDLNGITSRLDYLKQLGVEAIWLTPIYPSPQVDFGYDISDYENIDPQYGTLADFDHLIAEANQRHIRIIMDMVMNHTSDKHKWFLQSRSSRTNPYRDWYMWHDGKAGAPNDGSSSLGSKGETATSKGEPPNNWQSDFGHSAWEWDDKTRQYYYHKFYIQQPDLNWNNPKVHQAFKDICAFWLKRGVAGFRFDAITTLFEDPQMRDEDVLLDKNGEPYKNVYGDTALNDTRTNNLPEVHPVMAEMRAAIDKFDSNKFPGARVLIGETYLPNIAELETQYGSAEHPEFQLPMDTQILSINKMDAATFRAKLTDAEQHLDDHTPLIVFDNHDNPRIDARYGDGMHDEDIERVLSTILFASRGAALFYYGDEIGMKTTPPTRREDVKDPVGLTGWPKDKGRDGERTPMQWDAAPNAGFTTESAKPWLPIPPDFVTVNVKAEEKNPASLFDWYQALIRLKETSPALAEGSEAILDPDNPNVLSWLRKGPDNVSVIVSVNFKPEPQTVSLSVPGAGPALKTLLKTPGATDPVSPQAIQLGPFGVYVGELRP